MDDLERVLASWRKLDARFERVRPTRWGAVVTDRRFPSIRDVNYARIEPTRHRPRFEDVVAELAGDLTRVRAEHLHCVVFHPDRHTRLLADASSAGAALSWEIVMTRRSRALDAPADVPVAELRTFGPAFWRVFRRSAREFGAADPRVADQVEAIERRLLRAGKRWFAVRDARRVVALASLLLLDATALIDHVVTLPHARRRGYADAIVRRLCDEAGAAGAKMCWLITDPDGPARRLYERLGFAEATTIASTLQRFDGVEPQNTTRKSFSSP